MIKEFRESNIFDINVLQCPYFLIYNILIYGKISIFEFSKKYRKFFNSNSL